MGGSWFALGWIAYGTAVSEFEPVEGAVHNQVPLQIGDEVYAFEQFKPLRSSEDDVWYRGFAVATSTSRNPAALSSTAASSSSGSSLRQDTALTPQVTVGIFPAKCVFIREYLEDAEGRLTDAQSRHANGQANGRMPVLEEEPEEEEIEEAEVLRRESVAGPSRGSDDMAARKAKNRTSVGSLASFLGQLTADQHKALQDSRASISTKKPHKDNRPAPPLPNLKCGDETTGGLAEPLVDEIACALREWSVQQYAHVSRRDYKLFDDVLACFNEAYAGRKLLLAKTLSIEESDKLRARLVQVLLRGNMLQGSDVIVRHPTTGALVDVEAEGEVDDRAWLSAVRLYSLQVLSSRIDPLDPNCTAQPDPSSNLALCTARGFSSAGKGAQSSPQSVSIRLGLDVISVVASALPKGEVTELYFSLFSKSEKRFVTEEFCVLFDNQGQRITTSGGSPSTASAMFEELGPHDFDELYLVCKVLRNGLLKSPGTIGTGSVGRKDGSDYASQEGEFGVGSSNKMLLVDSAGRLSYRRPFACAVTDLSHFVRTDKPRSSSSELDIPIFVPTEEADFATLHEALILSNTKAFEKTPRLDTISLRLRVLVDDKGTATASGTSLDGVCSVQRLGFPDVVHPEVRRNDVYVKLWAGDFSSAIALSTFKASTKSKGFGAFASAAASAATNIGLSTNIEVAAEVRLRDGTLLEKAISRGAGEAEVTQFHSVVFKSNSSPCWAELLKLNVRPEQLSQCHLFLTFRARGVREKEKGGVTSGLEKPFAFAYLPLVRDNAAFVPDGNHSLALYRFESNVAVPSMYMQVPATRQGDQLPAVPQSLVKAIIPLKDSMILRTLLVSTENTSNDTLLALLNWNKSNDVDLKRVLAELQFCSENEICKFLRDVFDALFDILLCKQNESGDLDSLVFEALVRILGIVSDRRFANFKSVLDVYLNEHFRSSTAYRYIIECLNDLCRRQGESAAGTQLRSSIKVLNYLVRFVVRSRALQRAKDVGSGVTADHLESNFKRDLTSLLGQLNMLMKAKSPSSIIGTQTLAVQHFADVIPELEPVFDQDELADIVITFCDSISASKGKIQIWKVLMFRNIVSGSLFRQPTSRAVLVPNIARWLKAHLGKFDDNPSTNVNDPQTAQDNARVSWLEGLRLAASTLATMLDVIHVALVDPSVRGNRSLLGQEQDNVEYILGLLPAVLDAATEFEDELQIAAVLRQPSHMAMVASRPVVFPTSYPFPLLSQASTSASTPDAGSESTSLHNGATEMSYIAVALLFLAPPKIMQNWLEATLEVEGSDTFVKRMSQLFRFGSSAVTSDLFPSKWLNVNILAHRAMLKVASSVAALLKKHFIPEQREGGRFKETLWLDYLQMLVRLLGSPQLLIEEFAPQKRRAVWRLAGDLRAEGARLLSDVWEALGWPSLGASAGLGVGRQGGFQIHFVPALVEDVLSTCISHHDELRAVAVHILYTMIINEYTLNGNFAVIQAEVIDRLDRLFMNLTKGDEISRAYFVGQLRSLFESSSVDDELREQVREFLDSVDNFLELLLSVRNLPEGEEYQEDRITGTLRLMDFVRGIGRNSIYIVYVNRLVAYHTALGNHTEAGLTLKRHADLHTWDLSRSVEAIPELELPKQSEFARKEVLTMRVINHLNQGKAWEIAIQLCKELAEQLETQSYNYLRLSEVLTLQAELCANIVRSVRQFGEYYRVAFYGRQWPASLSGKQFVYRGNEGEKMGAFVERLRNKYPGSVQLKTHSVPDQETQESDTKYIQITPVVPEPDLDAPFFTNAEVPHAVRTYYELNEVSRFSFTSSPSALQRDRRPSKTAATEKMVLSCEDAFPSILQRSEVVDVEIIEISPIETALEDVSKKVAELQRIEKRFGTLAKTTDDQTAVNTNLLSMALNSAIDAPVNQGVPMYRRQFLTADFVRANPSSATAVSKLRDAIDELAVEIARCLKLHLALCPEEMMPFHETLQSFFERNFSEEIARLPSDLSAASTQSPTSLGRDISRFRSHGFGGSISISAPQPSSRPRESIFSVLASPRRDSGAMSPLPGGRQMLSVPEDTTPTKSIRAGSISGFSMGGYSFTSGDGRSRADSISGSSLRESARRASGQLMNSLKWSRKRPSISALAETAEEHGGKPVF